MDCPHHDIENCEDCPAYPCVLLAAPALPVPRANCALCPLARCVADFQRALGEEQAYLSGDMETDEGWLLKGAGQ